MFTWICPKCGREVPPSYSECPDCAERAKANSGAATSTPAQPSQPAPAAAAPSPPLPDAAGTSAAAPAPPAVQYVVVKQGLPGWLVALFVAAVLMIIGAGAYLFLLPSSRVERKQKAEIQLESPPAAGQTPNTVNPFNRFLEAAGVRLYEENRKVMVKVILVNHSAADMPALEGVIYLQTTTADPSAAPLAQLPFKGISIAPHGSREIVAPIRTTLRAYELPDWQFLRATVELKQP